MVLHYHGGPTTHFDEGLYNKTIKAMYSETGKFINSL